MPKDPKKNIDRFKVRGGEINEYDFEQNQEELAEEMKRGQKKSKGTEMIDDKSAKRGDKSHKKAG